MKAYVFPGQGAQFTGMAQTLLDHSPKAADLLSEADDILGFALSEIMLTGSDEDLRQTRVTQPAIFVHSVIRAILAGDDFAPDAVAGHSLGEFSALTAAGALSFKDGLKLVHRRAEAMQAAGEATPGTMAAIVGLEDAQVEDICAATAGIVIPANYNCPGQLVISGEIEAVQRAMAACTEAGARRALQLPVGGAFHSPLMEPAREELEAAINETNIQTPRAKVYQNVDAKPHTNVDEIRTNLIAQLTGAVRWTASVQQMKNDGVTSLVEVGGKGSVLRGLIRKIDRELATEALV
ncbi:MAG: ACP S-malonyltransferase [Saprospiraceae bacterium]